MAKKALLVGINRYKIPGADLRGCVNDVKNLRTVLTTYYGFAGKDIKTLTDYAATTKAMRDAIAAAGEGRQEGGRPALALLRPRRQRPRQERGRGRPARRDPLPHRPRLEGPASRRLAAHTFDRLPAGVNFTVVMDCCHSGTNTRAILPPDAPVIPRYLPNPWDLMATESGRRLRGKVKGSLRRSAPARRKKDIVAVNIPEVLVTGCRDTQTSADAEIGGSFNGALTYHLVATDQGGPRQADVSRTPRRHREAPQEGRILAGPAA